MGEGRRKNKPFLNRRTSVWFSAVRCLRPTTAAQRQARAVAVTSWATGEQDVTPPGLHATQYRQCCTEPSPQACTQSFQVTGSRCQLQNILLGVIYPKYKLVADGRLYSNCFCRLHSSTLQLGPRVKYSYAKQGKCVDPRGFIQV